MPIRILIAALLLTAACGQQGTSNNVANNAATNNTATNNTVTSNTANDTVTNNTVTNNTINNTTNGTVGPTLLECPAVPDVTTGALDDLTGYWQDSVLCALPEPFELLQQQCPGMTISRFDMTSDGLLFVSPEHRYARNQVIFGQFDLSLPAECAASGCAAAEATFDGVLGDATADSTIGCVDDSGGCRCTFDGMLRFTDVGLMTSDAPGAFTAHHFEDGVPASIDWVFDATANERAVLWRSDKKQYWSYFNHSEPELYFVALYCAAFMANCNTAAGVTGYADYADCFTQAQTLTTTTKTPEPTGDSVECRFHHVLMSADPTEPSNRATYCPSGQFVPTGPCTN